MRFALEAVLPTGWPKYLSVVVRRSPCQRQHPDLPGAGVPPARQDRESTIQVANVPSIATGRLDVPNRSNVGLPYEACVDSRF
ncbi:hypothetical protein M513_02905, partial [Trichuris suis]